MINSFGLSLPDWVSDYVANQPTAFADLNHRMKLAITLSALNIEHQTGGPFGAAIFDMITGKLISVGVNMVVPGRCSLAHAEMVAIALAQKALDIHDLAAQGIYQLVTSCQPCAMCLGAIPWSGVKSLVCGARGEDAEAIGFNEGAKPDNWTRHLQQRGIETHGDILRDEAADVLRRYHAHGGIRY
ncbi:MAG: nucleoside deaminase [Anaerohalosphaeraceae bacterium]